MSKGLRAGWAWIAVGLAVCGCSAQPRWGSNDGVSPAKLPPRETLNTDPGPAQPPAVTRSQKPDGDPFKAPEAPPLPQAPPADLLAGQPAARIGVIICSKDGKTSQAILNEEVLAAAYQGLVAARDLPEPERSQRRAEIWNAALNQLIEREVVLQDAFDRLKKAGGQKNLDKLTEEASGQFEKTVLRNWMKAGNFKSEDEFREYVKKQGVSLDMLRRQWERNFMAMEYLRSRVHPMLEDVGPQQIFDYYDKHPEEFHRPDSVQWQDLFVASDNYPSPADARRLAEQLAERARGGEDFAALAQQYDNSDSSLRKGEGIGSKRGEIRPPEVENVLFQLKDGEAAVVELEKGFHVVRVIHREYDGPTPLDEKTQKQIKDKLTNETAQTEMKRIVNKLKHDAVIVYNKGDE